MKKLINQADNVVVDALKGMEAAHPDLLKVSYDPKYIVRADAPVKDKVAVVSALPPRISNSNFCHPVTEKGPLGCLPS